MANISRSNMCLPAIPTSTSARFCLITGLDQQYCLKICLIGTMLTTVVADVQFRVRSLPFPRISNSTCAASHVRHGAIVSMAGLPMYPASLSNVSLGRQLCGSTHVGVVHSVAGNLRFDDDKAKVFFEMLRCRPLNKQMWMC